MGMFDYVDLEIKCPRCGAKVDGFQTKDNGCYMTTLAYWTVNNFYSGCDKCGLEFNFNRVTPKVPLSDYDVILSDWNGKKTSVKYSGRWSDNIKLRGKCRKKH